MSTTVLEASPESGNRNDPFSSNTANIYVQGTLQNARIGGTTCGLAVVMESAGATEHVGSLAAQTLASHPVGDGGVGAGFTGRKRHHSTSKSAGQIKRRRKTYERNGSKPKFLLGGSITDPLNLNSLDDEEISKIANAVTPACSPLPHVNKDPDPVIVPQDFKDPLKLNIADDGTSENNSSLTKTLVVRKSSGKKKKYHNSGDAKRDSIESLGDADKDGGELSCARPLWLELQSNKTAKLANKIVSPVLPDSRGRKRKASRTEPSSRLAKALLIDDLCPQQKLVKPRSSDLELNLKRLRRSPEAVSKFRRQQSHESKSSKQLPKFRDKDKQFQYGNYARYYGYRTPNSDDNRIEFFKREWFEGKKCLDIGCNSGHVTLAIGKLFNPSKIVGVDIDGNLIATARKNVKHCLQEQYIENKGKGRVKFPASLQKMYGPLAPAPDASTSSAGGRGSPSTSSFPANVLFRCANFVLERDSLLDTQKEEYDTILCLSVTKWIHLNWGDAGIKRFFKRIFRALHPGGRLILEPQAWQSYQKKRKMTETTYHNYYEIKFRPHQFKDYLLSQEVGFASCEVIGTPLNKSKGFRRPMVMFTKLHAGCSRPVSRRPSTEKPAATISSSSSIPTSSPPQPLMMPAKKTTSDIKEEMKSKEKREPKEEPITELMMPAEKTTSGIKEEMKSEEKREPKEEPITELMMPAEKTTSGIKEEMKSEEKWAPKEEPITEEMEGVRVDVKDAGEKPAQEEKKAVAVILKMEGKKGSDETASDAVAEEMVKVEAEKNLLDAEEKGDIIKAASSSSKVVVMET